MVSKVGKLQVPGRLAMFIITRKIVVSLGGFIIGATLLSPVSANDKKVYGFGTLVEESELERFTSPLPDGRGLPEGSGSVMDGAKIYATQCLACHGVNLEGGIGDPLIGGRGTLVNNDPTKPPLKTVESYWPYATTLFDYVKRTMPFTAPGSLTDDEVYAVSAYILSRANIIEEDVILDKETLEKIEMPNKDGFIPADR